MNNTQQSDGVFSKHISHRILKEITLAQRLDLFAVLRSGDLTKVKAFIGDTLSSPKGSRSSPVPASFLQRAAVMRQLVSTQPLLHCCVGEPPSRQNSEGTVASPEGRMSIALYLLSLKGQLVNLGLTDEDGRTALHLAAKKEDSAMLKLLLAARDDSAERKAQLDINAKCTKSGWTILHYAASQGDVASVRMLMDAGATLVVHAVVGKPVTPLDLVKTRLQNSGHFSSAHIANLQRVAKELSEVVRNLEKAKQQKEAERLLKEENIAAARKKLAEREEKERELLERKQKQLKDKQERDRNRDLEEDNKKSQKNSSSSSASSSASIGTKSSSSTSSGTPQSVTVTVSPSPSPSPTPSSSSNTSVCNALSDPTDVSDNSKMAKKKKKKDKKVEDDALLEASNKVTVVNVASRDELVDHLLAMGFAESDCFSAISLFGKDLDRALSWLCDRPTQSVDNDVSTVGTRHARSSPLTGGNSSSANASVSVGGSSGSAALTADGACPTADAVQLQKEKDHREELRRVNRAWNLKAEDEKKKVSTSTHVITRSCVVCVMSDGVM